MEPTLKIDRAAYEMLEEPMIRVPYELMRRNHRAAQRLVEREFNGMSVRYLTDCLICIFLLIDELLND